MSEQQEQPLPAAPATPGEWLRQERERQGRTLQQIAADLHLGIPMIEAIENNQFAALGAPVFARGHLRKYASLLGLSVERVHELYQNLSDRPREPDHVPVIHRATEPSIPMSPDSKDRRSHQLPKSATLVIAGGGFVVLAVVAWWFFSGSKNAATNETAQNVVETAGEASGAATEASGATAPDGNVVPAVEVRSGGATATPANGVTPAQTAPASTQEATQNKAGMVRGKVRLHFKFSQESWVEVYDARGNRRLYDVGQPGQTRSVDVDAPAQIVLGLAAGVVTEVNGREVAVPARRIASQVARFTVAGDGAVQ